MSKRYMPLATFVALVLALLVGCKGTTAGTETTGVVTKDGYTEKELKLFAYEEDVPKTLAVRFYDEAPSVPYIGLARYMSLVLGDEAKVDVTGGVASITSTDGGVAIVDDEADTISSDSWATFHNYIEPMQEGKGAGFIDFDTRFCRISSLDYEAQTKPVTFDMARYGINLHVDKDDAYLPLATASDLMAVVALDNLSYNGRELCLTHDYIKNASGIDPDWYVPIAEDVPRAQDMVDFSYAELCFAVDTLYSCSGKGILDQDIAAKGLDATLSEKDELTQRVQELLKSTDKSDYIVGLQFLGNYMMNFHVSLVDAAFFTSIQETDLYARITETNEELTKQFKEKDYYQKLLGIAPILTDSFAQKRLEVWPDEASYHEQGDTAVISFDSFMDCDYDGWDDYYEGKGERPDGSTEPDTIGTLLSGLERAKTNPEIKNVVIDMSANGGGSNDLCATAVALLTGQTKAPARDLVSDQRFTINYEIDTLFDGSFDSTAGAKAYDFNYAVLTSHNSFSCGSYFPSLMRDAGIPIIGEASGGGTDMITYMVTPDGQYLTMTNGYAEMTDAEGIQFENGVPIDVDLVKVNEDGTKDYSAFYDIATLSEVMNKLHEEEALPAAA